MFGGAILADRPDSHSKPNPTLTRIVFCMILVVAPKFRLNPIFTECFVKRFAEKTPLPLPVRGSKHEINDVFKL